MLGTEETARDVAIIAADGLRLYARHWAVSSPRAVVVMAHGLGEHSGNYEHIVKAIGPAAGVDFVALDFRGHGRSPGRRGFVRSYDELTSDLFAAFDWAARERPELPRYLLGHSNGGQVALRAALDPTEGKSKIAGLILSNPSLRLAVKVPGYKLRLGAFLNLYAPWVTLPSAIRVENLTRDPEMRRKRNADKLNHSRISAPLYFGMVEGGQMILDRAAEVENPLLVILGGADPVVDPIATRDAFDRFGSADKTLLFYPQMLHEPFNELGREKVFADVIAWLDRRITEV